MREWRMEDGMVAQNWSQLDTLSPLESYRLTEQHGTIYHFGATWHPRPGETMSLRLGPFIDEDEGRAAKNAALEKMGYTRPRWWQWWRWGEYDHWKDHLPAGR